MIRPSFCARAVQVTAASLFTIASAACGSSEPQEPAVATPTVTINHDRAPAGSPIEVTYKFIVANGAGFAEDYRVFAHVVDTDEERMWDDDHNPPTPTSQWKPGQTIEYTRTIFVPIFPYVGEATIQIGLHSLKDQKRLALTGEDVGQRSYRVAKLQLLPQTENLFTVFKDGWHPAEVAPVNAAVEWQWTKKEASLAFRNPKKDSVFYLDLDNPGGVFNEEQQVQVRLGDHIVDTFTLTPGHRILRKIPLAEVTLGSADMVELRIWVDKTFVPALVDAAASKDPRELGVRVFHAFVEPAR